MTNSQTTTQQHEDLHTELAELRREVAVIRAGSLQAERHAQRSARQARVQCALALGALMGAVFLIPGNRAAVAQGYGLTLQSLAARLSVVESKTQYMSVDTTAQSTTFSGCNLFLNNGTGASSSMNGLGNLTVGYNTAGNYAGDVRTGSHNLILGDQNNYSSHGGIVAGYANAIAAPYASVTAGRYNRASGQYSSVSGGANNEVTGPWASASGGDGNLVSGQYASASGGFVNWASGDGSSVSGGHAGYATGFGASISGGFITTAANQYSSISGGSFLTLSTDFGWLAGSLHSP